MVLSRVRLDQAPMDRRRTAQGILELREVDPAHQLSRKRRTGSLRQDDRARALGVRAEADAAYAYVPEVWDLTSGTSVGFSVRTFALSADGDEELIFRTEKAEAGAANHAQSVSIFWERVTSTTYRFVVRYIDGAGAASADFTASTMSPGDHTVGLTLPLLGSGNVILYANSEVKTIAGAVLGLQVFATILGGPLAAAKPTGARSVFSNLVYFSVIHGSPTSIGSKRSNSATIQWYLDGADGRTERSQDDVSASDGLLFLQPTAPEVKDGELRLGGRSGTVRIEHNLELERFWSTLLESAGDVDYALMVEFTPYDDVDAREQVLVDYGELLNLKLSAADAAVFTYNGTAITNGTLAGGTQHSLFVGREADTLRMAGAASGTAAAPARPYLDLSTIKDLFIGAAEDAASGAGFRGSIAKLALFPKWTTEDLGPANAVLYLDLTERVRDISPNTLPVRAEVHAPASGEATFTQGPLEDAVYRGIEAGVVLADSGPSLWEVAMDKAIGADVTGHRVGWRAFMASNGQAHLLDTETERLRTFGIQKPAESPSLVAITPGVLDGAYGYGWRYVTAEGTFGPIRRLPPVLAAEGSKVLLGSTRSGESLGSELGQSYIRLAEDPDTGSIQSVFDVGTPIPTGKYVQEVYGRLPDLDEEQLEEQVTDRGLISTSGNGIIYARSNARATQLDPGDDFKVQFTFEYNPRGIPSPGGFAGTAVMALTDGGSGSIPKWNADFFACIIGTNGGDPSNNFTLANRYAWAANNMYGKDANHMVVGIARRKQRERYDGSAGVDGRQPCLNHFLLTFSTEPTWTAGNNYEIIFERSGQALIIWARDLTAGTDWLELVGRSMKVAAAPENDHAAYPAKITGGGYSDNFNRPAQVRTVAYDQDTMFAAWSPKSTNHELFLGAAAQNAMDLPYIVGDSGDAQFGQPVHGYYSPALPGSIPPGNDFALSDQQLFGFTTTSIFFHARAWRGVNMPSTATIKLNGQDRWAAEDSEPLNGGLVHDIAFINEPFYGLPTKAWDRQQGVSWSFFKDTTNNAQMEHRAASSSPTILWSLQKFFGAADAAKLSWAPTGNGSFILDSGEQAYVISRKVWDPLALGAYVQERDSDTRDADEFNWFSFELEKSGLDWSINNLAVNGALKFTSDLALPNAPDPNPTLYLLNGHDEAVQSETVEVAEYRWWDDGLGPDIDQGAGYFLTGRLPETSWADTLLYLKFQPEDRVGNALLHYGTNTVVTGIRDDATLEDTRTGASSTVSFPLDPGAGIVGIEVGRTFGVPVQNAEVDEDVQIALDAARTDQLYLLKRLPIGVSHFTDNAPDQTLGAKMDERSGFVPEVVNGIFTWEQSLGLVGEESTLHFSEPGPNGWESFPTYLDYKVPGAAGALTACQGAAGFAVAFGSSWATRLVGSPMNPTPVPLGGGVGANDQASTVLHGQLIFSYNGTLWAVGPQGDAEDIGKSVQDLLPASARLFISASLASLFVVDRSGGPMLRFYLPDKTWTIEDRGAVAGGDGPQGLGAWVQNTGTWAEESPLVFGDDAALDTGTYATGQYSGTGNVLTVVSSIKAETYALWTLTDEAGNSVQTLLSNPTLAGTFGPSMTFASSPGLAGNLSAGLITISPGAPAQGMLLDSGPLKLANDDDRLERLEMETLAGSGWEVAADSGPKPGDRSSRDGLTWRSFGASEHRIAAGNRGEWTRVAIRNTLLEGAELGHLEALIRAGGGSQ